MKTETTIKEICKKKGIKLQDVAAQLWPDSNLKAQRANMSQLINGERRMIRPEWIAILARELKISNKKVTELITYKQ